MRLNAGERNIHVREDKKTLGQGSVWALSIFEPVVDENAGKRA